MPDETLSTGVYYLCSPNNPTGAAYSAEQLAKWVDFACRTGSLIIYDAAYEAFVTDDSPARFSPFRGRKTVQLKLPLSPKPPALPAHGALTRSSPPA